MKTNSAYVHLGDRLHAIERIRSGAQSAEEVAADFGVGAEDVTRWLAVHADDRIVTLAELRGRRKPAHARLELRARRLTRLVEAAEREVRQLERELLSKELGENTHQSAQRVVLAQRKRATARLFVDGVQSR